MIQHFLVACKKLLTSQTISAFCSVLHSTRMSKNPFPGKNFILTDTKKKACPDDISYWPMLQDRLPISLILFSFYPIKFLISSSTVLMPPIPKFSTSTLATFGDRKAGRVGPRCIFFTPRCNRASSTITAFCSYQAIL